MFNKIKKRNDHRKIFFDREFQSFFRFINKYSTRQFAVIAVIVATAVICTFEGFEYIYRQSVITRQTAVIQNEAVLIAAEYSNYESLEAAENNDMNSRLSSYSALNQIRIRIVNLNYVVSVDTYSIDTNKTILNPRVFDIFSNHKNSSGYDKKTGNIQAAVPVYNDSGKFIAVLVADLDYTEIDAMFHDVNSQNNNIKLVIITICLALLIVGIYFLNRPVKRVLDIVSNVSAGHTDERIPVRSYTEIREIADDFNNIMDRANETDQSRAEFVSNVSHELKTPITSIKVLAESLNTQENVPIEVYQEFMQDIVSEIDRESKIIEDLLTLVRMDKSVATLNVTSVNMNDLLEMTLKRVKPLAQKKNIELLFESFSRRAAFEKVYSGRAVHIMQCAAPKRPPISRPRCTDMTVKNRNQVELCGTVEQPPVRSHENHGEVFFRFPLAVPRLSGQTDHLQVLVPAALAEQVLFS